MSVLAAFLQGVVYAGRLMLREPLPKEPERDAQTLLAEAFHIHALSVAGPPIAFDAATALAASQLLYQATWCFLNPNEPLDPTALSMPGDPQSASQHLSADVVLRHLSAVHRRARALRPGDELAARLADLLRRWPLSGVLADIEDAPLTPVDFAGYRGLQLLYAERLAQHEKPGWFPTGPALESVELVWQQLGRDINMLTAARATALALAQNTDSQPDE